KPNKKKSVNVKSERTHQMNLIKERWGMEIAFREIEPGTNNYGNTRIEKRGDAPLPEELQWHSGVIFTNLSTNWQIIYVRGTNAAIVERKFGAGTVVMAGDSYFISNEAMVNDRHPELLSWLVGASHDVVFDEAHFGIMQTEGVAALFRKYHLYAV